MKKGLFSLLGLVAFVALALMPATSFAAPSSRTAQSHKVHIFHSRGHAQPPKAASTTIGSNVPYHGGPVMAGTMNVFPIFWEPTGNVSANYNYLIERYFGDVGGSPLYNINKQYTQNGNPLFFPTNADIFSWLVDTTSPYPRPGPLLDSDIQTEVTHAQTVQGWPSNIDNVFVVFTEKNVSLCTDSHQTSCTPDVTSSTNTSPFCAYHGSFGTNNTIYAAIPYAASPNFNFGCTTGAIFSLTGSSPNNDADADQTINVTSHEQMEAATDPYPMVNPAWIDTTNNVEIGDLCAFTFGPGNPQGADVLLNTNPYIVQQEWSNAISGCTLTTNTATKYYQIKNRNSGLAMDVSGGGTNAGAQVIQWFYHSGANQQWAFVPDGTFLQIKNRNSGLVLDVSGASTSAGANVIQWTTNNGFNQQWVLVPDGGYDAIVNFNSGMVLDVSGGSTNAGAHVIQSTFNNSLLNQQWASVPLNPYYEIVNRNSGLVADVSGGSTSAGAHVIQWPYHSGLNQQWALVPDGSYYQIVNLHSGLVMDVSGASTSAGAQVIQWTNHNGTNQQWSVVTDGAFVQIVNRNSNLVLDVFGASKSGGANVIQWTNHNGLNQQWSLIATSA
jgi:Ricin-type beta-trefoil lectin domain-like